MTSWVVDASVAVKWYVPETHSDAALRLLDREDALHVPDLFFVEFGNILWKKARLGELETVDVRKIVHALRTVPLEVHSSDDLLDAALVLALARDRAVYHALYIALAVALDCPLVTADARLIRALERTPLRGHMLYVEDLRHIP